MAKQMPPGFPQNTVHVQRALVAVSLIRPLQLVDTVAALYHASFAERQEVASLKAISPVFERIFGSSVTKEIMVKVRL